MYLNNSKISKLLLFLLLAPYNITCSTEADTQSQQLTDNKKVYQETLNKLVKLLNNIGVEFKEEIDAFLHIKDINLDQTIKIKYGAVEYPFPYISYSKNIKAHILVLKDYIKKLNIDNASSENTDTNTEYLKQADLLVKVLDQIYKSIVINPAYIHEKQTKREFDRLEEIHQATLREQAERLKIELEERRAKIDNQNKISQTQMQEQLNKLQKDLSREKKNAKEKFEKSENEIKLINNKYNEELSKVEKLKQEVNKFKTEKRQFEQDKLELESHNRRAKAQINQLIDGANVKSKIAEAIADNDKKWRAKLEDTVKRLSKSNDETSQKSSLIKSKLQKATSILSEITRSVSNPPFNPKAINGLQDFIDTIKENTYKATDIVKTVQVL